MMHHLKDGTFDSFVAVAAYPVIIDCCSFQHEPCGKNASLVEELSRQYEGRLIVGKLNVDENPYTTGTYNITVIPTVLYFLNGSLIKKFIGNVSKDTLLKELKLM